MYLCVSVCDADVEQGRAVLPDDGHARLVRRTGQAQTATEPGWPGHPSHATHTQYPHPCSFNSPLYVCVSQLLQSSLKGTEGMRAAVWRTYTAWADIRPVQELQETESAVTCLSFGHERHHRGYALLATGAKDGSVTVYRCAHAGWGSYVKEGVGVCRCYRTEMELSILKDVQFRTNEAQPVPQEHSNIAIHSRMVSHIAVHIFTSPGPSPSSHTHTHTHTTISSRECVCVCVWMDRLAISGR